jgi:hypothetical protein
LKTDRYIFFQKTALFNGKSLFFCFLGKNSSQKQSRVSFNILNRDKILSRLRISSLYTKKPSDFAEGYRIKRDGLRN